MSALPWIKLWAELPEHPKSDRLERLLGRARAWTHVVELWLWAARQHGDGDLSGVDTETIARRAGWRGNAEKFVAALRTAGFLDEDGRLHGWDEHQAAHVAVAQGRPSEPVEDAKERRRRQDRERKARKRSASGPGMSASGSAAATEMSAPVPHSEADTKRTDADETRLSARAKTKNQNETETDSGKNPAPAADASAAVASSPGSHAPAESTRSPRARKAKELDPARAAELEAERSDADRYLARFRELHADPKASFGETGFMAFRQARKRRGFPELLTAMEALAADAWGTTLPLQSCLSEPNIQRGLAMAKKQQPHPSSGVGIEDVWTTSEGP